LGETVRDIMLDAFVVMPNHVHGVLIITDRSQGRSQAAPTGEMAAKPLGRLIGAFKTKSTRVVNEMRNMPGVPIWQRNYHEHIVRSEDELNRIRQYIMENPPKWNEDPENPETGSVSLNEAFMSIIERSRLQIENTGGVSSDEMESRFR